MDTTLVHIQYQFTIIVCEILLNSTPKKKKKKKKIGLIVSPKSNGDRCMGSFNSITIF